MEFIRSAVDFILRLDVHLAELVRAYGFWTYSILFVTIFLETGLVVMPFLPGDSLLFAAGALSAVTEMSPHVLVLILSVAAILGDTANYWIGHYIGPKVFHNEGGRLLNRRHLQRAHEFYERHGGKTIVLARFIPIIRTFAPFVAGVGSMDYRRFIAYNVVGGVVWVALFVYCGYFFGNIPIVKRNFSIVILAIIVISVIPVVVEFIRQRRAPAREKARPAG